MIATDRELDPLRASANSCSTRHRSGIVEGPGNGVLLELAVVIDHFARKSDADPGVVGEESFHLLGIETFEISTLGNVGLEADGVAGSR